LFPSGFKSRKVAAWPIDGFLQEVVRGTRKRRS
jgi:hypothetical protein